MDRRGNWVAALMAEPGEGQRWAGLVEDTYWRVRVVGDEVVTEAIHDDRWLRISTSGVGSRVRETVLEMALKHGKRPAARVARTPAPSPPAEVDADTVSPMPPEDFWRVVAALKWGEDTDYKAIGRLYHGMLTAEQRAAFEVTYDGFHAVLAGAIAEYEHKTGVSAGCGDDSFNDLCAHVVGLGREVYERELASPTLAVERGRKGDFTESFAYTFQVDDRE